MDGLEINEINLSEAFENKDFRIDSEFYENPPFEYKHFEYVSIGTILKNAQYGLSRDMNEDGLGYKMYRMNEMHDMLTDIDVAKHAEISKNELELFRLHDRDVLFNRTNSFVFVGRTGLYKKIDDEDFIFASYLIRFNPDETKILPEFLTVFLNTKLGIWDIKRRARQSINQANVNAEEVKAIKIPLVSLPFQNKIKEMLDGAHEKRIVSEKLYHETEELLLKELGLNDFIPSDECVAVKSFSESFGTSGRIDAEYYQLKYDDIIGRIKSYRGGYSTISEVCTLNDMNFTPNDDETYNYIELSNIGLNGEIKDCMREKGADLPTRARRKVNTGQVVVSSIEGSLQSIAIVGAEYDNALCSTGFYAINSKQINSETLLVLLKNEVIQAVLKKGCSGTILTAIGKDEFLSIPLPIVDKNVQVSIAEKISESFTLRTESKRLLEEAKTAVERAIEQGESSMDSHPSRGMMTKRHLIAESV